MSDASNIQKRKQANGGLHITMYTGEFFEIIHGSDTIKVYCNGRSGYGSYSVSVVGPPKFRIIGPKNQKIKGD